MKRSDRNMNVKAKIYVRGGDKSFLQRNSN
jgi:hypothetical protein